ncbi:hypothetical protein J3E68DRAFT_251908 [Trichoderma sp. SZMC 28012]
MRCHHSSFDSTNFPRAIVVALSVLSLSHRRSFISSSEQSLAVSRPFVLGASLTGRGRLLFAWERRVDEEQLLRDGSGLRVLNLACILP